MVYTLSRGGNETFSLGNKRIYGAWGDLRYDGNPGDGPNTQYCANLGHKKDNESGLTYMRARYYEPWTGRFVSEDQAADGWNWFVYCGNNSVNFADFSGTVYVEIGGYWFRWDHPYQQEGTGKWIQDLTWGDYVNGQRRQRGSIRPDGSAKHGEQINDRIRKMLRKAASPNAKNLLNKAGKAAGRYGLMGYVAVCSLDYAFLSDPYEFIDLIGYLGGDWTLLQGLVVVGSD